MKSSPFVYLVLAALAMILVASPSWAQTPAPNIQPVFSLNRVLITAGADRYFAPSSGHMADLGLKADTRLSLNIVYNFKYVSLGGGEAYYTESKDAQPFLSARLAIWRNGRIGG